MLQAGNEIRMRLLITGAAGFIGSALARHWVQRLELPTCGYDALTYAGTRGAVGALEGHPLFSLVVADIRDRQRLEAAFEAFQPDAVAHLAAETHVDRSIDGPRAFMDVNVMGTLAVLEVSLAYWRRLPAGRADAFRFLHVSTDEVFGALGPHGAFTEASAYAPRSPYAASKAASDHVARSYWETFGLPVLVSNCSNNYGAYQFPEKLIPLMILNGLAGRPLPLYGDGMQVRDWIAVEDHVAALALILERGAVGETYLVGARCERTNRSVVESICHALDMVRPEAAPHARLISHVKDRPGHDRRYAIDPSKIETALGFRPRTDFTRGIERAVAWYAANAAWWTPLRETLYQGERLGLGETDA
jgi:dTDP-glucose 4,6-dehydratase